MTIVALACVALSWALIVVLCVRDPKRRRAAGSAGGDGTATRRTIAVAACLPGVALAIAGDAAAFLVWLGGSGIAGWLTTAMFNHANVGARDFGERR